ncbi:MAG: hypothetical protein HC919_02705 [Oscillatoriales cyanobacterium SM2_2_1]|nr:hypothetical protein [Oscillatoriales cyanobacterium SM2_2_1]
MNQVEIQKFIDLEGVMGLMLTKRRMRPYFFRLGFVAEPVKEALSQAILQVLETLTEDLDSFEFHFTENRIFIYKLSQGLLLLVVTDANLNYSAYQKLLPDFRCHLEKDTYQAVSSLKHSLGSETLPTQPLIPTPIETQPMPAPQPAAPPAMATRVPPAAPSLPVVPRSPTVPSCDQVMESLNVLSRYATQYLGKMVVINYWKVTRPDCPSLEGLSLDRAAQFVLSRPMAAEDLADTVQVWVRAFVQKCKTVIKNFDAMVQNDCGTAQQRRWLGLDS